MSKFMMGLQLFLMMAFFIGIEVEANPLERCTNMMNFDDELDNFVKLGGAEQLNVVCRNMTEFYRCIDEVMENESGFKLRELAQFLQGTDIGKALTILINLIDVTEELCTEGNELHEEYMENAECYRNIDDNLPKDCEKQAKDAYEAFSDNESNYISSSSDQQRQEMCMVSAYQLGCLGGAIREECGEAGFEVYRKILQKIGLFKSGICTPHIMSTMKNDFVDSLDISESRKSLYRTILELRKRRK